MEKNNIDKELIEKGKVLYKKLKNNKDLSNNELVLLGKYIQELNNKTLISQKIFEDEYHRIFKSSPISISNKLRDEKGKPIKLKNNKYKILSNEPSDFMSSQFCVLFKFKFRVSKNKYVVKVVPGYSQMIMSHEYKSENDLIQLVYSKALAAFLTSIGYSDGSLNAARRISTEVVDKFWITYVSFDAMINHNIAQVYT
jgi:hypothetical protein